MKLSKLFFIIFFLVPSFSWADCTEPVPVIRGSILFYQTDCTGAGDGSVADVTFPYDEDFPFFLGLFTWPTSGGTAPDAADILLFDASFTSTVKLDVLGSTDGSTAVNGLNGISATVPQWIPPLNAKSGAAMYPSVVGDYTMHTINQGTAGADWSVRAYYYNPSSKK